MLPRVFVRHSSSSSSSASTFLSAVRTLAPASRVPMSSSKASVTSDASSTSSVTVSLPVISAQNPPSAAEKAHHTASGHFKAPWKSFGKGDIAPTEVLWSKIIGEWKPVKSSADMMPLAVPAFLSADCSRDASKIRATWLGHATFLTEMPSGINVLFDPLLGTKCAPSFLPGFGRISPAPCKVSDLPRVDVVCISHAHYDHLDTYSIKLLMQQFPGIHYFVPLGMKAWFEATGVRSGNVTELDWWDQRQITVDGVSATVSCLPAQHTSNRTLSDHGKVLCASWAIDSPSDKNGGKVYFAGDTGYRAVPRLDPEIDDHELDFPSCPAFKEIGEYRGPFDLALLPIGAYSPRHIMSRVHSDPEDSVNIFKDVKAKRALAMHFGTWILTDEPILEPIQKLKQALKKFSIPETGVFDAIQVGQSVEVDVVDK
ncbi:beta-lactamase superfamily domain-containing protein [Myxozyma melibiosi]|uniref:Beta-lactamase superfamily domain-containing protein n=1 Tax=Myxozyma melibiosi TaxID=54550 RepID=A0ABR1F9T8_9ASCO